MRQTGGKQDEHWAQAGGELANTWITREPAEVISRLESIEMKFSQEHRPWSRPAPYVCRRLAEKAPDPLVWFDAMLPTTLPADVVRPFVEEAIRREVDGWERALRVCFATERLRDIAIRMILTQENAPHDLQRAALDVAGQYAPTVESLLRSRRLSQKTIIKLFQHTDKELVGRLAIAGRPRGEKHIMVGSIRPLWEKAIIECCEDEYWLRQILKVEPALGLRWFEHRFTNGSFRFPYLLKSHIEEILADWSLADRKQLLEMVPDEIFR